MERDQLIVELRSQGIRDSTVLRAITDVPRPEFVPPQHRGAAWENHPLPIGSGQTISQPFIVAYMVAALSLTAGDRVLDVGTGCGYQAAILAACGAEVISIEVRPELAESAEATLRRLGYPVRVVLGDGQQGWADDAPYDGIAVAAVASGIPPALRDQLRSPNEHRRGGRLILPVRSSTWSGGRQRLVLVERMAAPSADRQQDPPSPSQAAGPAVTDSFHRQDLLDVAFVPLIDAKELA